MEPDWSALPKDLLETIASSHCTTMEDFMAFRGVCTSWRAAATKDRFVSVSKVPLLMLAEKEGSDEREFYSLAKRKICTRIPLPGAKGMRCNEVGFGWILAKASTGEVCLMKPFSSAVIQLPNFKKFPNYREHIRNPVTYFISRAWLTANPSETSDFTLLIDGISHMGLWKNGEKKWTNIKNIGGTLLAYCKGKGRVYAFELDGHVWVWDSHYLSKSHGLVVQVKNGPTSFNSWGQDYLVVSSAGELLIINRNHIEPTEYAVKGADHFGLKRVDLVRGECVEINSLGKDAVFIGDNAAVSVDATEFPGILKPNCIYFTDDIIISYYHGKKWRKGGGKDMGIYNIDDGSIERFDVESYSFVCPPLWVFPSF